MKKSIVRKKILIGIIGTLIVGGIGFVYIYMTQPMSVCDIKDFKISEYPEVDKVLTKDEVKSDIEEVIEIIENTHPIFLDEPLEEYSKGKEELLNIEKSMTTMELQKEISKYLTSINDGHTRVLRNEQEVLDINFKYIDGNLILLDENNNLTKKKVIEICNKDINEIIKEIQKTFPAENYIAEATNIEVYAKEKNFLESIGVKLNKDITVKIKENDREKVADVKVIRDEMYTRGGLSIYSEKIDKDAAYIRLGTCEINPSLEKVIKEIDGYLNEGITNFIIDVSNNVGGNSKACAMILEKLKIKTGEYGAKVRFSPLAKEQRGYFRKSGSLDFLNNNKVTKNENIDLYVITDEKTFSSAQMLAVGVKDGNLGTIVGRPSSNMPSHFGDVLEFQLKNSKIIGTVSHKKWMRPDKNKNDEKVLEPDIYVEYGEDLLEKTLDMIKQKR